jgi:hypothetical protein
MGLLEREASRFVSGVRQVSLLHLVGDVTRHLKMDLYGTGFVFGGEKHPPVDRVGLVLADGPLDLGFAEVLRCAYSD